MPTPNLAGLTIGDPCYKNYDVLVILSVAFGFEAPAWGPECNRIPPMFSFQTLGQKVAIFTFTSSVDVVMWVECMGMASLNEASPSVSMVPPFEQLITFHKYVT